MSVVLSDANTPGEGEHKFMQFVREQRQRPGWNPNTVHCVYGLDADLIHLALASHEPHFYILREIVFTPKGGNKEGPDKAKALAAIQGKGDGSAKKPETAKKPFQFLKIAVLREYLVLEFSDLELPFQLDPERVVDDFVMMCFFVGNDFLPHMPTLDIREKGIELMIKVYRDMLPHLGGYMANGVNLSMFQMCWNVVRRHSNSCEGLGGPQESGVISGRTGNVMQGLSWICSAWACSLPLWGNTRTRSSRHACVRCAQTRIVLFSSGKGRMGRTAGVFGAMGHSLIALSLTALIQNSSLQRKAISLGPHLHHRLVLHLAPLLDRQVCS